ncbi:recombinase family protein [Rhizobium alvei]|uniref:Recombinase family protein n=1 Tax=Rhizobium alvei TaxID=1132659 RepID=A0ABT8YF27_9HYPH|nr:recombinase family protein [Rhizobium alvei]MDO6962316.1 recombinase family protein [Rhizobium alvei]
MLQHIREGRIDIVVVYKIDRLTRSQMDFSKLVDVFDRHSVSFVSVTQQFNTTTSMGRLTLNVLLSFCPSPSSSARSPPNASATRSPPPSKRACSWAAACRSATVATIASWRSMKTTPIMSAISFVACSNSNR